MKTNWRDTHTTEMGKENGNGKNGKENTLIIEISLKEVKENGADSAQIRMNI